MLPTIHIDESITKILPTAMPRAQHIIARPVSILTKLESSCHLLSMFWLNDDMFFHASYQNFPYWVVNGIDLKPTTLVDEAKRL